MSAERESCAYFFGEISTAVVIGGKFKVHPTPFSIATFVFVRKKDDMSIKVLLADDSHVMLAAIRKRLAEDSRIRLVGAVSSFAAMMQMISDFRPEVLLLDLHLPEERHFTPDFIKSQLGSVPHTLAVSLSNDAEAKALAASYGAESLLDKMKLYIELVPTVMRCSPSTHADHGSPKTGDAQAT